MGRKIFGLTIVFVMIASFGLAALFVNVPSSSAAFGGFFGVGCAGINEFGATLPQTGYAALGVFDFSGGDEAGVVITVSGDEPVIAVFPDTGLPFAILGTTQASYTTTGHETKISMAPRYGGDTTGLSAASCTLPSGEMPSDDGWLFRDGRLNANTPNAPVVFYATDEGIVVYPNDNTGVILDVNAAFLANKQDIPGENTLYWESEDGSMQFWKLSSGEYQFMVGPEEGGNYYVIIFDAMPPTKITNQSFNIYNGSPTW